MSNTNQNTSGTGKGAKIPPAIAGKINWGAFLLNWIWGLGNKTYITLVIFASILTVVIPFIGMLVPLGLCIWFGLKGNEWAWQNKKFESVKQFNEIQTKWAIAGLILAALGIISLFIIFGTTLAMFTKLQ